MALTLPTADNSLTLPGVYIHIPFCRQACHYCNFHFSTSLRYKEEMIAALVKEIHLTEVTKESARPVIGTLYFGGGTPSILEEKELLDIFRALKGKFMLAEDTEITLEANPDDITAGKLQEWRSMGINRLSVGIQSFSDSELKWMNRSHTAAASLGCIKNIKEAGFTNFSADLIYGSPLLNDCEWKENVAILINEDAPHISCYAMTVEPGTALHNRIGRKISDPVDPEKQAAQFLLLMEWMAEAGYEHYEISNFARKGFRSRHNSSYWSGVPYFGFGPAAHSFNGSTRSWNIANNASYIKNIQHGLLPAEQELLTPTQQLNEYIMTSLRTKEGLNLCLISHKFGNSFSEQLAAKSKKWEAGGKLIIRDQMIALTNPGKLFADGIAADLFF